MSNAALTWWQGGFESTPGTPVAATRKLYIKAGIPTESRPKEVIEQSRQNFIEGFDEIETHAFIETIPFELKGAPFADLGWWFNMYIKGGVSPTGSGPYVHTFNDVSTSDDLKASTLEASDGVGTFQIPYALGKSFELGGKGGSGPTPMLFKGDLYGQKLTPDHTMTAAISDRDLRGGYMAFKNTQIFIDDAAGGIGGTEVAASLEEINIKLDNKFELRWSGSADGTYYTAHRRLSRSLEFTAKLRFTSTTYAEFKNKFRTNTGRYIQIKNTGGGNNLFTLNLYTKPRSFEFMEDGATRQVGIMGRSIYDPTLGYGFQVALQNDIASYT